MPSRSNELAGLSLEELLARFESLGLASLDAQIQAEFLVRSIEAFKESADASRQAGRRLETLTQWFHAFSVLFVVMAIVIVVFTAVVATGG